MKCQIFKKIVPPEILYHFLKKFCIKKEHEWFLTYEGYRKCMYNEYHKDFIKQIEPYYHISKQYYLHRDDNYRSFVNIIRQICKSNNISVTSNIKYLHSKYEIEYYIEYIPALDTLEEDPVVPPHFLHSEEEEDALPLTTESPASTYSAESDSAK